MSTHPRNPRYFPRMKVRGARRHRIAWFQRVSGGFDQMAAAFALSTQQLKTLAEAIEDNEREMREVK